MRRTQESGRREDAKSFDGEGDSARRVAQRRKRIELVCVGGFLEVGFRASVREQGKR